MSPVAPPSLDNDPLYHFARVDTHLYRSAQPTRADLVRLHQKYGICRVIQLDDWYEAATDSAPGVATVRIALPVLSEPSPEALDAIAHWIDTAPCPVLVHCKQGQDRTGLVVALYRIRTCDHYYAGQSEDTDAIGRFCGEYDGRYGFDVSEEREVAILRAWAEMWRHHWHPYKGLMKAWMRAVKW